MEKLKILKTRVEEMLYKRENILDDSTIVRFDSMDENGINHTTTQGYMWFPYTCRQVTVSTRLNRGIVRGIKSTKSFL